MAHLRGLILRWAASGLLFVALSLWFASAQAIGSVSPTAGVCPSNSTSYGGGSFWVACNSQGQCGAASPTQSQACLSLYPQYGGGWADMGGGTYRCTNAPSGGSSLGNNGVLSPETAPPVSCNCATGYQPNSGGTACVAYGCTAGQTLDDGVFNMPTRSSTLCVDGCVTQGSMAATDASGQHYAWGPFVTTGSRCDGSGNGSGGYTGDGPSGANEATQPPVSQLPPGQCPGTVNGQTVIVPCGTTSTTGSSTGTSSTTSSGGTTTAGPGTTGTRETTCSNGTCTTTETTTTTNPDGTRSTQQVTSVQNLGEFCAQNAGNAQCGGGEEGGSSFGGGCGAGFQCEGDAVQCAIAREQHQRACDLHGRTPEVVDVYTGLRGDDQTNGAFTETIGLTLPTGPAGSCAITDPQISFGQGHTLTVPLASRICPHLDVIRGVLTAFGMLAFVVIVARG